MRGTQKDLSKTLVAQGVKKPTAMQETLVQSQCQEDPLEEEMATHSCLANPMDTGAWWARVVYKVTRVKDNLAAKPTTSLEPFPLRQEFSSSAMLTSQAAWFFVVGGASVLCRRVGTLPGLFPPEANSISSPQTVTTYSETNAWVAKSPGSE